MGEAPRTYRQLLELGWVWAQVGTDAPHLVPPHGDVAICLRPVERTRRVVVTAVSLRGCRKCMDRVGIVPPHAQRRQLELPVRRDTFTGE